ncbi:phosphatidylglycerophosphatase B [Anaerohalosphaera lusitana]|uniref:Phosphatidylglycerophosphatase B n=1 Tax=Anaerohalosphaera lusitana TaxID=1936003 RepID=A0A1U9NIQ0_9BACT|nr:phosphatase PAP2 family protein [Anaerohalosphaera lusitana]AQT67604.1 phosphatidylglycerophosphatase B [Anaerohalosphaera lusitana]
MIDLRGYFDKYGSEIMIFAAMVICAGGLWGFIEVVDEVYESDTQPMEEKILQTFRDPEDPAAMRGPDWLRKTVQSISATGNSTVLILVVLVTCGYLFISGNHKAMWTVLITVCGGAFLVFALKGLFDRPRPDIVPHLAEVTTASFPSGHAAISTIVYATLGAVVCRVLPTHTLRIYTIAVAATMAFLIGCSRVLVGVHYPTDVLGGWMLGLAWAAACWLVVLYLQRRGMVESEDDSEGKKVREP